MVRFQNTGVNQTPCVFLKPHRVGGTYWRRGLENCYSKAVNLSRDVSPELSFLHPGANRGTVSDIVHRLSPPYDLSARHVGWNPDLFDNLMSNGYVYVTLLRDPLMRSISYYHAFLARKLNSTFCSYDDWYRQNAGASVNGGVPVDNYYAWFLGLDPTDGLSPEALREKFAFVGITEKWIESTILLADHLNLDVRRLYPSRSMASGGSDGQLPKNLANSKFVSPETKRLFTENNRFDYQLYNHYMTLLNSCASTLRANKQAPFIVDYTILRLKQAARQIYQRFFKHG